MDLPAEVEQPNLNRRLLTDLTTLTVRGELEWRSAGDGCLLEADWGGGTLRLGASRLQDDLVVAVSGQTRKMAVPVSLGTAIRDQMDFRRWADDVHRAASPEA